MNPFKVLTPKPKNLQRNLRKSLIIGYARIVKTCQTKKRWMLGSMARLIVLTALNTTSDINKRMEK